MAENVVIIGAGGSGRGFIARLLKEDGASICFIDKNKDLIRQLLDRGEYLIRVGEKDIRMSGYDAFMIDCEEAVRRAAGADWIFISVGEEKLPGLSEFLGKASLLRGTQPLRIVVCENGIAPKNTLRKALAGTAADNALVTQGVIFCTSIPAEKGSLDILSEDYSELPYDTDEQLFLMPFRCFPAKKHFDELLQRKIYTYNCLSACIAYLGYYLGYTVYAEAANDPGVKEICRKLCLGLNRTICKSMNITPEEQNAFSERALAKFSNPAISDTIQKNARSAVRKLSPTERIMGPMKLMRAQKEDVSILQMVAAAALFYLEKEEKPEYRGEYFENLMDLFEILNPEEPEGAKIYEILNQMENREDLDTIMIKLTGGGVKMKNKAAVMTAVQKMEVQETDMPVMGDEDVLIEVENVGICGSDMLFFEHGRIGAKVAVPPFILGHEAAGTVQKTGKNVTNLKVGDKVAVEPGVPCGHCKHCLSGRYNICETLTFCGTPPVNGLYRKYITHPARWVHKLPEGMSTETGALIEPLAVGVHAVKMGEVGFGKTVLILGSGCIGLMTLFAARQMNADRVIVVDLFDKRLQKAKDLGADVIINASECDTMEAVRAATDGQGADVVFETAGNPKTAYQATQLVARGGTVVQVGTLPNDLNYNVRTLEVNEACLKVIWRYCNDFPTAIRMAANDPEGLSKVVTDRFELENIQEGFMRAMKEKKDVIKAVIRL